MDRMKKGQYDSGYVAGEVLAACFPRLSWESPRNKGVEVLYMVDPVGEYAVQRLK